MALPTTSNTSRPVSNGYAARLDSVYLRLAVGFDGLSGDIETAPLQPQQVNLANNPEDFQNEYGQVASRRDLSGGEGLRFAVRPSGDGVDLRRFWSSDGVVPVPPGDDEPFVRLAFDTSEIRSDTETYPAIATDGTTTIVVDGQQLQKTTDTTADPVSWSSEDPHDSEGSQNITDLCVYAGDFYAAIVTNGIHRRVSGTWSHWSDYTADRLWVAKQRVIATDDSAGTLVEAGATTTSTTIATLADATWDDVCDAGAYIVAACSDGNLVVIGEDGSGGLLPVATVPTPDEVPTAVGWVAGRLLYATQASDVIRVYSAVVAGPDGLADIQLLREWDDSGTAAIKRIATSRTSALFGVTESASLTRLWRWDASTSGLWRELAADDGEQVYDITFIDGKALFSHAGGGYWSEQSTYTSDGWVIFPAFDMFTTEAKSWAGLTFDHPRIEAGSMTFTYSTDIRAMEDDTSALWQDLYTQTSGNSRTEFRLSGVSSRYLTAKVDLTSSGGGAGTPKFRSMSVRSYPPEGDIIVKLPVNVSDQIERPGRRRFRAKGHGDLVYDYLKGRQGQAAELELFRPSETLVGLVESVSTRLPFRSRNGSQTLVSVVTFRGRRPESETGSSSSDGGMGIGLLGVETLGGVE